MSGVANYSNIFNLEGRTAIVTGGSRGIGLALAEGLAAHGADVAIVVKSTVDRAETAAQAIRAARKGAGLAVVEFAPDGFARLGPKEGRVLGPTNTVEERDGAPEIAGWGDSDDLAVWKLRLPEPGRSGLR